MKILHTSDWHLGQIFYGFNREEEFRDFFAQLRNIIQEEKPDAMLVSGDIFDVATPSNAVVTMYNRELLHIQQENSTLQTIVTAGNHDSPSRLSSAGVLWKEFRVTVVGTPERIDGEINLEQMIVPICQEGKTVGWVLAVPYMHGSSFPPVENDSYTERVRSFYGRLLQLAESKRKASEPIIAMGHLTLAQCDITGHDVSIGNMDSVPTDIWNEKVSYVALGHIHRPQLIGKEQIRYSGSVLPMSFDERYQHSVTIVDFEGERAADIRQIPIKPLIDICTVPEKASPFETVKAALKDYPDNHKVYLRANILAEGVMPADMFGEALACLEGKENVRFCTLCQERKLITQSNDDEEDIHSLDELRKISPIDVARRSYMMRRREEMPDSLIACMKEAIEETNKEGKESLI